MQNSVLSWTAPGRHLLHQVCVTPAGAGVPVAGYVRGRLGAAVQDVGHHAEGRGEGGGGGACPPRAAGAAPMTVDCWARHWRGSGVTAPLWRDDMNSSAARSRVSYGAACLKLVCAGRRPYPPTTANHRQWCIVSCAAALHAEGGGQACSGSGRAAGNHHRGCPRHAWRCRCCSCGRGGRRGGSQTGPQCMCCRDDHVYGDGVRTMLVF